MEVDGPEDSGAAESSSVTKKLGLTPQERAAKMAALREKMRESAIANRRDLIEESNRAKNGARELARLERKRQLAETLREKIEAQETGEDLERKRNWEYSIEEDEEWTKRMDKKKKRADFQFHDEATSAYRKYKKDLDLLQPDLIAYNLEKEKALGLDPGTLVKRDEAGRMSLTATAKEQSTMISAAEANGAVAEGLYRDANSLSYADNKPSEEAIDRVVNKLNNDLDKRRKWSRKRTNEDEGDVTYINERNKVFNKKIARFYDKYTKEIRESFERGTAV
ncbi:SYF2-domain-containing protein [Serendipita vermifera]|nr:SYF2-domain-containing protein [Serendipita vermifera]